MMIEDVITALMLGVGLFGLFSVAEYIWEDLQQGDDEKQQQEQE